jgi:hypothetical protein
MRQQPWILTSFGMKVEPFALKREQVVGRDVANALGNKCRFSGLVGCHYSVAQHSVVGAMLLLEDRRLGEQARLYAAAFLLHDVSEAYLPDIPSPLKPYVCLRDIGTDVDDTRSWAELEREHLMVISAALGFPGDPSILTSLTVRDMDSHMLQVERAQLLPEHPGWLTGTAGYWSEPELMRWSPRRAVDQWLELAVELLDEPSVMRLPEVTR